MRIALGMLAHKTYGVQHLVDLLVDVGLVLDSLDLQAFGDYLTYGHPGVKGCNRILIDHLDLGHKLLVGMLLVMPGLLDLCPELCYAALVPLGII